MTLIPNLDGRSRLYAVWGDPVAQVMTPTLINPIFARHGHNLFAVPFHVTPDGFEATWHAFRAMSNVAGIGVTVPHKIAAARLCDSLTPAAQAVGAVNSVQRQPDGTMDGALFDGLGFVGGLGAGRTRLKGATVLQVGAGGAGRAIAHALAEEDVGRLAVIDRDPAAVDFTVAMVNRVTGRETATRDMPDLGACTLLINATPIGLESTDRFPVPLDSMAPDTIIADIASFATPTRLMIEARERGFVTADGNAMLEAQIGLIAGYAAGLPAGSSLD